MILTLNLTRLYAGRELSSRVGTSLLSRLFPLSPLSSLRSPSLSLGRQCALGREKALGLPRIWPADGEIQIAVYQNIRLSRKEIWRRSGHFLIWRSVHKY